MALADRGEDMISVLSRSDVEGRPLTRDEIAGSMHVTFADGRDTVIHAVTSAIAHLAARPDDLTAVREKPGLAVTATEELVR